MVAIHASTYLPLSFEPLSLSGPLKSSDSSTSTSSLVGDMIPAVLSSKVSARVRGPRNLPRASRPIIPASQWSYILAEVPPVVPQSTALLESTIVQLPQSLQRATTLREGPKHSTSLIVSNSLSGELCQDVVYPQNNTTGGPNFGAQVPELSRACSAHELANHTTVIDCRALPVKNREESSTSHFHGTPRPINSRTDASHLKALSHSPSCSSIIIAPTTVSSPEYSDGEQFVQPDDPLSRPVSVLPEDTIRQLEMLAEEVRTIVPVPVLESHHSRLRGPRPRLRAKQRAMAAVEAPQKMRMNATSDNSSDIDETYDCKDFVTTGDSAGAGVSNDIIASSTADVRWVEEYGGWCTSEKGKWKATEHYDDDYREDVQTNGAVRRSATSVPTCLLPTEQTEPYYIYDPHNAPEFLVGASTSLILRSSPGYHSHCRLHTRTTKRLFARTARPGPLVLASGSMPDLWSFEDVPHFAGPLHGSIATPQMSSPSLLHLHKQPDLSGLNLLIGAPINKPKHKPSSRRHGSDGDVVLRERPADKQARQAVSWSRTSTHEGSLSRHRHRNPFSSVMHWFRRWTR
ncbi:hypothetical protein AcV5_009204 [Taiwanofungus camphoratus]|nr:hypothetical protein AcV5_009204 [Antrodia cinnamomea]